MNVNNMDLNDMTKIIEGRMTKKNNALAQTLIQTLKLHFK